MKKLRRARGITLVEMLFTILILSILAILIVTGTRTIKHSFAAMEEQYKARVLAENILMVLTDEFRFARDVNLLTEGNGQENFQVFYGSASYGFPALLRLEPFEEGGSWGTLTIVSGTDESKKAIPFHSSYNPLWICPLDEETPMIQWNEEQTCLMVSFGICNREGELQTSVQDYPIRTLNVE